jgi:hypothetical protein
MPMIKKADVIIAVFATYVLPSMASAACEAQQWRDYRGTTLMQFPGSDSYFYATSKMAIDAAGLPRSQARLHRTDRPLQ